VNAAGVVVTLTNRPGPQDASRPSRGQVPLAALAGRTAHDAALRAADAACAGPNAFSLLAADRIGAWFVAHEGGSTAARISEVAEGLHTHTNTHDLDGLPAATVLAAEGFAPDALASARSLDEAFAVLRRIAPSHAPLDGTRAAACVHAGHRGTVSSALLALPERGDPVFLHAQGAPCVAAFAPVALR
jgi:hypothetical protein